jgi:tetratricopeptide (TPR) repeat protein
VSENGAAERFWLELRTLYQAAGAPTLKQLVRLGREQNPPILIGHSTINGWLNGKAVPIGRKNQRYLTVLVISLQSRVGADGKYKRLPQGEWGQLLRAAQAQRAEGKRIGRPRRPDISLPATRLPERVAHTAPANACALVSPLAPGSPLVGRRGELTLLADLVRGIVAGHGGTVFIEGEPGIGKSSLVRAGLAEAERLGAQVFLGTGSELDQALTLQPLLEGLRVREPSSDRRRETIARFLRGEIGTDRDVDGPSLLAEQLLALIAEECAVRPTILVIDDLQWADRASIGLLGRLAGSARQLPLLLVGVLRPVPQRDDLSTLRRMAGDAVRLRLAGLAQDEAAELVECLAGGTPDDKLLRLAEDAAGNPLYITELIAALARGSGMIITDGVATLTPAPAPRSLAAAIADRLGFISASAREVLQTASLLGPEFSVTDLASLLGRGVSDLAPALNEACAAGVLAESGRDLRFRHPLIHAALYENLPAPVRGAWHREAGRALAVAGAPVDRVARQLLWAAGEPDDSPEPMDEWLLDWLTDQAELLVSQAPQVAVKLLARAVANLPASSSRRGLLASQLAAAHFRIDELATAAQVAVGELEHAADPDLIVGLHWTLAQCRLFSGMYAESLATLSRALEDHRLSVGHRARLLVLTARSHANWGEYEEAGRVAGAAFAAAEQVSDTWAMGWSLHTMAIVATTLGRAADQLPLYDRGLEATQGDPALTDLRLLLQINKCVALVGLDRYEEALTVVRQARQFAEQTGATMRLVQARSVHGQLLFETGRWDDALAETTTLPPQTVTEETAVCCALGVAALISLHRDKATTAREFLSAADTHAARIGRRRLLGHLTLARSLSHELAGALPAALSTLTCWLDGSTEENLAVHDILPDAVRLAMRVGDLRAARSITEQATEFAAAEDTPFMNGNALYCRGMLGHDASLLLAAAEQYQCASRPLLRAKALEGAASALVRAGAHESAQTALSSAKEVYDRLGAVTDAARMKAAVQSWAAAHPGVG